MNEFDRLRNQAKYYKETYPPGTRIYLNHMDDPYAPVPEGTKGTVDFIDALGTVHTTWDNGRTLGLVPGVDSFRKLTAKELEAEQTASALGKKAKLDAHIQAATSRSLDSSEPSVSDNPTLNR